MDLKRHEECKRILEEFYPDRGGSAVRQNTLPDQSPGSMLDIIVPAYNVEPYVDACIKSVLAQRTEFSYRLILVDDGSTDSTGAKIDAVSTRPNVLVIHQENGGLSAARNTGLDRSDSKYVMFVDSDDILAPFAVERLLTVAERQDADIVAGSYCNFKQFRWLKKVYPQKEGVLSGDHELKGQAWGKVIKRELFDKVRFPEKYWYEDSVMHQIIYPSAVRKIGIEDIVYERRVNMNSITHSNSGNPRRLDSLWVTLRLMEDRQRIGIPFTKEYYDYLVKQTVLTHGRLNGLDRRIQECAFCLMSYRINECFPEFEPDRTKQTMLEEAIENSDFEAFCRYLPAR